MSSLTRGAASSDLVVDLLVGLGWLVVVELVEVDIGGARSSTADSYFRLLRLWVPQ